jgi:hypothetical protein
MMVEKARTWRASAEAKGKVERGASDGDDDDDDDDASAVVVVVVVLASEEEEATPSPFSFFSAPRFASK